MWGGYLHRVEQPDNDKVRDHDGHRDSEPTDYSELKIWLHTDLLTRLRRTYARRAWLNTLLREHPRVSTIRSHDVPHKPCAPLPGGTNLRSPTRQWPGRAPETPAQDP